MRRKQLLRVMIGTLAIIAVALVLGTGAQAQVKFKTLHKFTGKNGMYPDGNLIFDAAGNLYGTTFSGGVYNSNCLNGSCGTVFQLTPNANGTWSEHIVYRFYSNPDEGFNPDMGVTFDAAGNLYGTTDYGTYNTNSTGVVYELMPNTGGGWTYSTLYQFGGPFDGNPQGGMAFDTAGNLYGTTGWGCGYGDGVSCVFEMIPSNGSWTFNLLYGFSFTGSTGWYPSGTTPMFDAKGNLYATTAFGGNSGCSPYGNGCYGLGVVFELSPNGGGTWSIKDLHVFTGGNDGESPTCPLIFDAAGNLYGTTFAGGAHGYGNVFKLTPNADGTWTEHVLHQFTGGKDGATPFAGVTFDASGNLYGTTTRGGAFGYGVVFKLTPTSSGGWKETVLHAFANKPGAYPSSAVIFGPAGNLYGATSGDGTTTFGSVFEITP